MGKEYQGAVIDQIFFALRWWGPYTRVQFFMTMIPVIPCAMHVMSFVFLGRVIDHQCAPVGSLNVSFGALENYDVVVDKDGHNFSLVYGKCNIEIKNGSTTLYSTQCPNGYEYAEPRERSFVSEWDLVCDREAVSDVSQTLLALGMGFGALIFSGLADRYGRKPMYMLPHLLLFAVAIILAFVPNVTGFLVLRFFLGALQQGMGLVSNVLLIEMVPTPRRALASQVGCFVWSLSLLLTGVVAYALKEYTWRYTELVYAAFSFYILFQWWITDESVRWLVANKKDEETDRILRKAARVNKVDYSKVLEVFHRETLKVDLPLVVPENAEFGHIQKISSDAANGGHSQGNDVKPEARETIGLSVLCKNRKLAMISAISCYMWFTDSVSYYGLLMTSYTLVDDIYLGFLLNVAVELPAALTFLVIVNRIDRKKCLYFFHLMAAVTLLLAVLLNNADFAESIPGRKPLAIVVSLLGKYAVSMAFAILFLYSPELFPTNLRNLGFGISSSSARVGGMVAPFSRTFGRHIPWGPGVVFACLCLLVPLLLQYLPETRGQELPQTIIEMERRFTQGKRTGKKKKERNVIYTGGEKNNTVNGLPTQG